MSALAGTILAATLASSLGLHVQVAKGRYLQVVLVPQGPAPVLITPRTTLGCYVEVEILDATGQYIGRFGPMATCSIPEQSEFRLFWNDRDFGAQLFGVELDIFAPGRIRLASLGGEVGDLDPERDYQLVVTYHNDDARYLSTQTRRALQRRYGKIWAGAVNLRSEPLAFRGAR
jgi:hypothetical protein